MKNINIKTIMLTLMAALMFASWASSAYAEDGWEANLSVAVANAESRLSFGQRPDAAEGFDGKYDVPPMLGGAMSAYFSGSGGNLWRDVRSSLSDKNAWNVKISSTTQGEDVILKWDPKKLPADQTVVLSDATAGQTVDMKTANKYTYKNDGPREIKIEAAR